MERRRSPGARHGARLPDELLARVYLAVFSPLAFLLAFLVWCQQHRPSAVPTFRRRPACDVLLVAAMALLAVAVLQSDSFLMSRIASGERDSIVGVMMLGLVSSVMDAPRVVFGFLLVTLVGLSLKQE